MSKHGYVGAVVAFLSQQSQDIFPMHIVPFTAAGVPATVNDGSNENMLDSTRIANMSGTVTDEEMEQ